MLFKEFQEMMHYIYKEVEKGIHNEIKVVYVTEKKGYQVWEDADYFLRRWGLGEEVKLSIGEIPIMSKNDQLKLNEKALLVNLIAK